LLKFNQSKYTGREQSGKIEASFYNQTNRSVQRRE